MSINIITLKKVVENLPAPRGPDDHLRLRIINRVDELKMLTPCVMGDAGRPPRNESSTYQELLLLPAQYRLNGRCWYEWELVLGEGC